MTHRLPTGALTIQKNYFGAIDQYKKALALDSNQPETYNNLGVIYKNQNCLKKAESVYNKAFSLNPKHPGTNYNLGLFYDELKKTKSAIYFYQRFVEFGINSHPLLVDQVKAH